MLMINCKLEHFSQVKNIFVVDDSHSQELPTLENWLHNSVVFISIHNLTVDSSDLHACT